MGAPLRAALPPFFCSLAQSAAYALDRRERVPLDELRIEPQKANPVRAFDRRLPSRVSLTRPRPPTRPLPHRDDAPKRALLCEPPKF